MTKIVIICGPTACGKTPAAVELAKLLDGEVISADSMQVYRHMDIGTAKVTAEEMDGVPHYLIDELNPDEAYNVAVFKNRAAGLIEDITARGKMPIICGGTGFYINALLYNADFEQGLDGDMEYRAELETVAKKQGSQILHNMLKKVDTQAAADIDANNVKRVMRALEFYKLYGRPISAHNREQKEKQAVTAYDASIFVLHDRRDRLYERINRRVDKMLAQGLVAEVESLLAVGYSTGLVSMQGLGYKEIVKYLQGECSLNEAAEAIKQGTRRFAKRQITWFKHQLPGAQWIDVEEYNSHVGVAMEMLRASSVRSEQKDR
ncbi:MAG: tRNA (adenosine(37)-N6)-dimethylallyltransferase MiaA [Defluviitaleaceae bacterium]|nr:tRNA (adenosine(37)-N6)-dimethylallyltransferase MiaA [Defluviitaleaceae bacterium]